MLALRNADCRDDSELIRASLAGGDDAFRELIERHQDRLFKLLERYARDAVEAEDLAQEVFVKVFRKLHTFQHDSSFYTWLYRIAVNTASDYLAKHHRRRLQLVEDTSTLDTGARDDADGAAAPVLAEELRLVTRAVLDRLPDKYRTILILREYEDLSYTDMAAVLGCSIGTVESRLFRARQRFKEALEHCYPELVPQMRGGHRS